MMRDTPGTFEFYHPRWIKLGQWVINQRCRQERLTQAQIQALELYLTGHGTLAKRLGLGALSPTGLLETGGSSSIPIDYKTHDGFRLWIWVTNQRRRRSRLNEDQVQLLESVSGWTWSLSMTLGTKVLST